MSGKPEKSSGSEATIEWRDGALPVSSRFDDPYYSLENGLAETGQVFLAGNGLPGRLRDGFQVAELGFGTGLNLLALAQVWAESRAEGVLNFTSFEAFPMTAEEMARALAAFPEVSDLAEALVFQWEKGEQRFEIANVAVDIRIGDANVELPHWRGLADAWFLDGFAPARNPEMWSETLLAEVGDHTKPGGTAATYTAAGHVRRGLAAAGFEVERRPGFGRKRHMTVARKRG